MLVASGAGAALCRRHVDADERGSGIVLKTQRVAETLALTVCRVSFDFKINARRRSQAF
jgi:hypothetical protein